MVTALLVIGISESASVNNVIVVIKVGVLLVFVAMGVAFIHPANWHPFIPKNQGGLKYGTVGIFRAASTIFFAYVGFEAVSTAAAEAKNPAKDMPLGILGSLFVCTLLYIVVAGVLTGMVPYRELGGPAPIALAVDRMGPAYAWFAILIKVGAVAGLTSVMLILTYGQTRVFFAMARDGLLPTVFSTLHRKFRTPWIGTMLLGVGIAIAAAFLPIDILGNLVSLGTAVAFAIVCISVLWLRKARPDLERPFKAPGRDLDADPRHRRRPGHGRATAGRHGAVHRPRRPDPGRDPGLLHRAGGRDLRHLRLPQLEVGPRAGTARRGPGRRTRADAGGGAWHRIGEGVRCSLNPPPRSGGGGPPKVVEEAGFVEMSGTCVRGSTEEPRTALASSTAVRRSPSSVKNGGGLSDPRPPSHFHRPDPRAVQHQGQLAALHLQRVFAEGLAAPAPQRRGVGVVVGGDLFEVRHGGDQLRRHPGVLRPRLEQHLQQFDHRARVPPVETGPRRAWWPRPGLRDCGRRRR